LDTALTTLLCKKILLQSKEVKTGHIWQNLLWMGTAKKKGSFADDDDNDDDLSKRLVEKAQKPL
jgi:hypothetical protein